MPGARGGLVHLVCMTVSMRLMSAGDGYKYLLRTIAAADGDRSLSTPLTRYYAEEGMPPGNWMGSALPGLGDGRIGAGDVVSEAQLQLLIGMGRDPITGEPLGRAFPRYVSVADRISKRVKGLDPGLGMGERAEQISLIEAEEAERGAGGRSRGSITRSRCRSRCRCCGASWMPAPNP